LLSFGVSACASLAAFIKSAQALEEALSRHSPTQSGPVTATTEAELKKLESLQLHGFLFGLGLLTLSAFFEHVLSK
jgi:hypothetical protein